MEKIVIVSKQMDSDDGLIELLNVLFPDCDIYTASHTEEGLEVCPLGSLFGSPTMGVRRGNHAKHFNRR